MKQQHSTLPTSSAACVATAENKLKQTTQKKQNTPTLCFIYYSVMEI